MTRPVVLLLSFVLAMVGVGCTATSLPADQQGRAPIVRVFSVEGSDETTIGNLKPGETPASSTPLPTGTRMPTATITRTATVTPTATRTPRPSRTATPTPTASPTPRQGPDLPKMIAAMKAVATFRVSVSGPGDLLEEITPRRVRILVGGTQPAELVVQPDGAYLRDGSFWRLLDRPPQLLMVRTETIVQSLAVLSRRTHKYALLSTARIRAGKCFDWDVTDNAPAEPISICQGVFDDLPYRIKMANGTTIEVFDFGQPIDVPDPAPVPG